MQWEKVEAKVRAEGLTRRLQPDRFDPCPDGVKPKGHKGFEDSPVFAQNAANEEEAMSHYRRVRDQIKNFVKNLSGKREDRIRR